MPSFMSSREFNQDLARAKREAETAPVFVTDRGKPSHVLLSVDAYNHLTGQDKNLLDLLAMPGAANIKFDPPNMDIKSKSPEEIFD
ncbi:MAG: type II toxin-antitoxin system Phd/YefM family antitoxin [Proteobacteria bacterium]|nr:type II toxin-antitoxin system Phd/YefM family antitoxin [Pseudomonadota bacterium]